MGWGSSMPSRTNSGAIRSSTDSRVSATSRRKAGVRRSRRMRRSGNCTGARRRVGVEQAHERRSELREIADGYWEAVMEASPVYATFVGDHRYDDRMDELSEAAEAAHLAAVAAWTRTSTAWTRRASPPGGG